jgi:hypothetical protein
MDFLLKAHAIVVEARDVRDCGLDLVRVMHECTFAEMLRIIGL